MTVSYRLIAPNELDSALLQRWRDIQNENTSYASPYFCPEFTQAVGRVRNDVRVIVIENDSKIAGFFSYQLGSFGMGRPVGGPFSDYHGVIVAPGAEWQLYELMKAAGLSVWSFDHLVGDTAQFEPLATAPCTSPQMDLRAGFAEYERGRREVGSELIRQTQRFARKFAREVGDLRFVYHEPSALQRLIEWKSAQYRRSNPTGKDLVFSNPWTTGLLREILELQSPSFAGVCSVLYAGDQLVAAHMGMRSKTDWHYWFPSYMPDQSKYRPGNILLLRMAEVAQEHGIDVIDLGKGDSQYKRQMMTGGAPLLEGAVELPSLLRTCRAAQRKLETWEAAGGISNVLSNIPARALRRLQRSQRFR